jgi:uncharacterized protein DUF1207
MRWLLALMIAFPLIAQPAPEKPLALNFRLTWNPPTDIYAPYVADPRRSRHIIAVISALDSELPDSQNLRWGLSIGGTYGVARLSRAGAPDGAWQLDVEGRLYSQFDIHYALDEIGHDGRVGATLIKAVRPNVAIRVAFVHTSSHIGDEYLLRNNITERLSSRKEEAGAGISWKIDTRLRTYADVGYGLNLGTRNRPLRLQMGLELEDQPRLGKSRWYAALDATSFEENDYEVSANLQTGFVFSSNGSPRRYRFGIELYDGRSQLDTFFMFHERYAVIGMWLDL